MRLHPIRALRVFVVCLVHTAFVSRLFDFLALQQTPAEGLLTRLLPDAGMVADDLGHDVTRP